MWVKSLQIRNIKGFEDSGVIKFDRKMNILIGPNNSGKSIVIKAIYGLQRFHIRPADIRIGSAEGGYDIELSDLDTDYLLNSNIDNFFPRGPFAPIIHCTMTRSTGNPELYIERPDNNNRGSVGSILTNEPSNFIYPFLSKRKVTTFSQTINRNTATGVADTLELLVSKIDRISAPTYPLYQEYVEACNGILGFVVSSFASENGKQAGIIVNQTENIPLEEMGEGIANLVGLIVDLCMAKNKLFLIEELENDIHPKALKNLLQLIMKKSNENQFIISTHSNIVAKYLGSQAGCKIHSVNMEFADRTPKSLIKEVGNTPEERRKVLEDLGYEMFDYDMWEGWLFLEESSAERLIREFFIPWYLPSLINKLRTIAADGVSKVDPKFEDFNRLFLFTHLESVYKNKAWVVIDGDRIGTQAIADLKTKYMPSGWHEQNFSNFSKNNFEEYYPASFQSEAQAALQLTGKQQKRQAKKALLQKVLDWIASSPQQAKSEFEQSAKEVIDILKDIDRKLNS